MHSGSILLCENDQVFLWVSIEEGQHLGSCSIDLLCCPGAAGVTAVRVAKGTAGQLGHDGLDLGAGVQTSAWREEEGGQWKD